MRDKDSFMSFIYGLLIVLYRHIFFPQVVAHNTIEGKIVHMLTFIRVYSKGISVESTEIVCNLKLKSSLLWDFT
jgi:hypothetical protein